MAGKQKEEATGRRFTLGNLLKLLNVYRLLTNQSRKNKVFCYNEIQYD